MDKKKCAYADTASAHTWVPAQPITGQQSQQKVKMMCPGFLLWITVFWKYFSTSKSVSTIHCMDNGILYSYLIYFFLKLQLPQKHSSTGYDKNYNINYSWKWFQPMVKQYFTSQSSVSIWSNLLYLILDMIILYTIKCPSDQQHLRLYLKDHTEVARK